MIKEFVDLWDKKKDELKSVLSEKHPESYTDLVKEVIKILSDESEYSDTPDPNRVHLIDDGDYQGTQVFVIGATGYQPSDYWYVKMSYGSCSGCDSLQAIHSDSYEDKPIESQVTQYMDMALHIVQGLKKMGE